MLTLAEVRALVEAHLIVSAIHDSSDNKAAQQKNKTKEAQLELQQKKRAVFEGTVGRDSAALGKLTEDDLRFLFG